MLFHGTSLDNITKIIYGGFNRDYNIKSLYGKGTYFSNEAKIAAEYCTKFDERIDTITQKRGHLSPL